MEMLINRPIKAACLKSWPPMDNFFPAYLWGSRKLYGSLYKAYIREQVESLMNANLKLKGKQKWKIWEKIGAPDTRAHFISYSILSLLLFIPAKQHKMRKGWTNRQTAEDSHTMCATVLRY